MAEGRFKSATVREEAYEAAEKLVKEGKAKSVCDVMSTATVKFAKRELEDHKVTQEIKELKDVGQLVQEIRELREAILSGKVTVKK